MISVCRFSLHRHSFHVILFDCRISSLFAVDIWISYLFIFANYFTVLQWFHFTFFFFFFVSVFICDWRCGRRKKKEAASAVCQFFHSRRLNESRRTVLNVREMVAWMRKHRYSQNVVVIKFQMEKFSEEKLPKINHWRRGRDAIALSISLWLLWLQINKANWQFIYIWFEILEIGLRYCRHHPANPKKKKKRIHLWILHRNFKLTLTYLFWMFCI